MLEPVILLKSLQGPFKVPLGAEKSSNQCQIFRACGGITSCSIKISGLLGSLHGFLGVAELRPCPSFGVERVGGQEPRSQLLSLFNGNCGGRLLALEIPQSSGGNSFSHVDQRIL